MPLDSQDKDARETMFRHHPTRLGTLGGSLSSSRDSGMLEYLSVCSSRAASECCQVLRRSLRRVLRSMWMRSVREAVVRQMAFAIDLTECVA